MKMLIDVHFRSPFRKPDWRWLRAAVPHRNCPRAARQDDGWVRRARRLRTALDRSGGDPGHPRVARAYPTVQAAYGLRLGEPRARWEVEARLLAGQDDSTVAARVGIAADVVEAYQSLFYDVRGRLENLDWVGMILGPRLYRGLTPDDIELVWKAIAYNLGPLALDALIGSPGKIVADASSATPDRFRMALAALTLPVNKETAPKLIRLAARLRQVEHQAASRASAMVFEPVKMGGVAGPGFGPTTEPKPQEPLQVPVASVGVEGVDVLDEDDRLPATFAPLVFHPPTLETATIRRETA